MNIKYLILNIILLSCFTTTISAQQVTSEDGKYYEYGTVDYESSGLQGRLGVGFAYFMKAGNEKEDRFVKDENGKKISFKSFASCINYFSGKGWTVFSINLHDNSFLVRKEISKTEAENNIQQCIIMKQ